MNEELMAHDNKNISRRSLLAILGASALALSIGGTLAYFTDSDVKVNNTTIAEDLEIEVVEPNWDPENGKKVVPTQTIAKDPYVHNLSEDIYGYMYIEVRIPIVNASLYDTETEKVSELADVPLFTYTLNDGWTEITSFNDESDPAHKFKVSRYYWKDVVAPGDVTGTVFDNVTVANLTGVDNIELEQTINVIGYGIQNEGFDNPLTAWRAYSNQNNIDEAPNNSTRTYAGLYGDTLVLGRADVTASEYNGVELAKEYEVDLTKGFTSQTSMPWFDDRESITKIIVADSFAPTSMKYLFARLDNCTSIVGLEKIDTSNCTDMSNVFFASDYITEIDLSSWDMSQVTTTSYMFSQAMRLTTIGDTSNWNLSNMTDMSEMFDNTKRLETVIGIDKWDVSNVTDMEGMFTSARGFKTLPIENWDTSNVTSMFLMFYDAQNVSVDCSRWNVSKVTNHSLFNTDAPEVIAPAW